MNLNDLKNDPRTQNIDSQKLDFLMKMASKNPPNNTKDMANVLMGAASAAKQSGMEFTPNETDILFDLLKQNMSAAEQKKADQIMMLMRSMQRR